MRSTRLVWCVVYGGGGEASAATFSAVGHVPVAGLALIIGIDRFMSEARALTNLIGNGVATVVVGKWCRQLDEHQLRVPEAQNGRSGGAGGGAADGAPGL